MINPHLSMKKKNAQLLKDIVDKWYDKAASLTLNPPDRVTVIQSVLAKVTDEEADVIRRMSKPVFLIRNCHVMHEIEGCYMDDFYKEALGSELYAKTNLGNTYEWCITEGGEPVTGGNTENYMGTAERLARAELSNITPTFYLLLQKLLPGEVDKNTFTLTSCQKDGGVASGRWDYGRASFDVDDLDLQFASARLRASVMSELTFDPKASLEISSPSATTKNENLMNCPKCKSWSIEWVDTHKAGVFHCNTCSNVFNLDELRQGEPALEAILAWLDEYHMAFRDAKRWRIELEKFLDKLFNNPTK